MTMVSLQGVSKVLSTQVILHPLDLDIQQGELIVVIGPSGSGKSTLLRLISGLDEPSTGQIWMNGRNMQGVSAAKRDIAMVFQDYALYPHMSVFNNMAYGLKMRRQPKHMINQRVLEVATSLGLETFLDRKPDSLSGGQRQRVAMGRALVREPSLFLFDEPLSNLDLTLKGQLRLEIKHLHQSTHITSLYVTHDQVEAMTLATRILVLNEGRVEQFDTPAALYRRPASLFVGTFMSLYSMNLLPAHIDKERGLVEIFKDVTLPLPDLSQNIKTGEQVYVGIRAEDMQLSSGDESGTHLKVREVLVDNMGADLLAHLVTEHANIPLMLRLSNRDKGGGQITSLSFNNLTAHLFLASSGERIGGWDAKEKK